MTNDENKMHLHFDNGWWDFILSDEPVSYGENGQNRVRNFENDDTDWDYIEKIFRDDVIIEVFIDGVNKGGLLASAENLRGFIPVSHILLEEKPRTNDEKIELLQSKVGNKTKVKIVECDASKNKVVLSERAAQTEDGKRKELISTLKPGLVVEGKVTNITDFGVFVDLGGVEGLVHISELSWGRVRSPSNYAELNQSISVQILSVDQRDMHVALSIKRLLPNPWFEIERKYKPGDVVAAQIVKILKDRHPDQLKLPFYLWTREAVCQFIEHRFDIKLSVWTVGRYLKGWGFTPQKPLRRAYEQNDQATQHWLKEKYPSIRRQATQEKARIYWGDEMGLRSDDTVGRSYGKVGKTPIIPGTGQRFGCSTISAITNQGQLNFMVFKGSFNNHVFLNYLKRLIKQAKQKVFLIVDRHPVNRANKVKTLVEKNSNNIRIFYLPS